MSAVEFDDSHFLNLVTCSAKRDPDTLAREIATRHGVRVSDMLGRSRFPHLVKARAELYRALRDWGWSFPAIGHFCGRDHTTVMLAIASPEKRAARALQVKTQHAATVLQ